MFNPYDLHIYIKLIFILYFKNKNHNVHQAEQLY